MAQSGSILIVEDNPETRMFYRWVLEREGFEVVDAVGADDAVAAVKRSLPCLILLDLIVPRARGFRLARELEDLTTPKDVPIIAISGVKELMEVARISGLRFAGYLQKPVSPTDLLSCVRSQISAD